MIDLSRPTDSGATYEIELYRDDGLRLMILDRVESFQVARTINSLGGFSLLLPANFDAHLLFPDLQMWLWRKPPGGVRRLVFGGVIKTIQTSFETGQRSVVVSGVSYTALLNDRAILGGGPTTSGTLTSIVSSVASLAFFFPSTFNPWILSVGNLYTTWRAYCVTDTITYGFLPTPSMLEWLVGFCNYIASLDILGFFEVVATGSNVLEFRFFSGQPGRDLTVGQPGAIVFSNENSNLGEASLLEDYLNSGNAAWKYISGAVGVIVDGLTDPGTNYTMPRFASGPFAYKDIFINMTPDTIPGVEGARLLNDNRPKNTLTGKLKSVPGSVYGVDWEFGDKVNVKFDGRLFETIIKAVTFGVDSTGHETLEAAVEITL